MSGSLMLGMVPGMFGRLRLRQTADVRYALPVPPLPRFAVDAGDGPAWGNASAKVTLVEFSDYQCPYCRRAQGVIDSLLSRYDGKIRLVHQDFPLDGHPRALQGKARARRLLADGRRLPGAPPHPGRDDRR